MRLNTWPLAAMLALACRAPAWAADPIAYTAPDGVNAVRVTAAAPLPAAPTYGPSGIAAVTATLTGAGASGVFTPVAGRTFHVQLAGTVVAACTLERQLDGATWVPITVSANGTTTILYQWSFSASANVSEDVVESQAATPYRVDCGAQLGSFTSGSLAVRISQ